MHQQRMACVLGQAPGWARGTFPPAKHPTFSPAFSDLGRGERDCLTSFNKLLFRSGKGFTHW